MKETFDKNLFSESVVFDETVCFYDITKAPFRIYGNSTVADNIYARMPETFSQKVSAGVFDSAARSAGVRVRFKTNSKRLGIKAHYRKCSQAVTQSALSAKGFDVYVNGKYRTSLRPEEEMELYYEQLANIGDEAEKDIIIYFPYFSVVDKVELALDKGSCAWDGNKYEKELPIVFYGSSVTQGFCVSRPGNIFSAMVSRKMNTDYINLGFSGVCRGEKEMADYIGRLKKSVVICEYDHNEPDAESLQENHLNFYKNLRKVDSLTPIILVSSPNKFYNGQRMEKRMEVVKATYEYALKNGDKNVYFINGQLFYPEEIRYDCSADAVHPNDLGAYMISERICAVLKKILSGDK